MFWCILIMFSGVFLISGLPYPGTLSFVQSLLYFLSPSLHFVSIYFIRYYLYFLYIICISFTKIQYGRKYIKPWCFTFTQKNPRFGTKVPNRGSCIFLYLQPDHICKQYDQRNSNDGSLQKDHQQFPESEPHMTKVTCFRPL